MRGAMRRKSSASAARFSPAPMRFTKSESLSSTSINTDFMCKGEAARYIFGVSSADESAKQSTRHLGEDMTSTEQKPYSNTREGAAFRFLGVPTLMRSTAETTNGAFGLMDHGGCRVGFGSPYHTITGKMSLFTCWKEKWRSCAAASG